MLLSLVISQDKEFKAEVKNNPKENVRWAFQRKFDEELQNLIEEHFDFYKKLKSKFWGHHT